MTDLLQVVKKFRWHSSWY